MPRAQEQGFAPSGEQVELRRGEQRATIVELGGGLRSYSAAGRQLLDGYARGERCTSARGQILVPWPNRLRDGRYEWAGVTHQLALSEPSRGNAIHGLARWVNWLVAERSESHVVMAYTLHPQDGYPFGLHVEVRYELDDLGLSVQTSAENLGDSACPYGAGAHPYLTVAEGSIEGWVLQAPGAVWMQTDKRAIPIGLSSVQGTEFDFRSPRLIGSTKLDTGYGELNRDADGLARVRLQTEDGLSRLIFWQDETYPYLMLFTGDTLPEQSRRRTGLAVEPMTCAPNAFQSRAGLITLQPGEAFTSRWGLQPG